VDHFSKTAAPVSTVYMYDTAKIHEWSGVEQNNYFLSWQLPSMGLPWLCVILVGCSVAGFTGAEKGEVLIGIKKSRLAMKPA